MAKPDTAAALENSRKALAQLEQEISGLEQRRNTALLNSEPASAVGKIDQQIAVTAHAVKTEQDRIKLFEGQVAREREQERLKDKLQRIEQVEAKFRERDELGKQAIAAIEQLDEAYRSLFLISRELRDLWPWRMVDMAPVLISESEIESRIAAELWRIGGRPVPTGGALPDPSGGSLPNVKPPSIMALGNPGIVEPLEAALEQASRFASDVMREGKSSGPIETAAVRAAVGPSGRTHAQLTAEMMRLGSMEQTEDVERRYAEVVAELSGLPLPDYLQQTKPKAAA
jgi:hypothetical protein